MLQASERRALMRLIEAKLRPSLEGEAPEIELLFQVLMQTIADALEVAPVIERGDRGGRLELAYRIVFGQAPIRSAELLGIDSTYVRRVVAAICSAVSKGSPRRGEEARGTGVYAAQ